MQNTVYLNHVPQKLEKYTKKGIEIYLENENKCHIDESMDDIILLFIGEIYNSREICKTLDIDYQSYEHTIKHAYKAYGIEETIRILDGHYIFILFDHNIYLDKAKIYIARDIIGIYPLYIHTFPIGITSQLMKNNPAILRRLDMIDGIAEDNLYDKYIISSQPVPNMISRTCTPGSYNTFSLPFCVNTKWRWEAETRVSTLAIMPLAPVVVGYANVIYEYYSRTLAQLFDNSVAKMVADADIVVCIDTDIYGTLYGTYMAKIASEICVSQNKKMSYKTSIDAAAAAAGGNDQRDGDNIVILHTGNIENLFQIRETNPVIENRVLRDHIENHSLYDIRRQYEKGGQIVRFPFWDITWIQFYMTMQAKYRGECIRKYFV